MLCGARNAWTVVGGEEGQAAATVSASGGARGQLLTSRANAGGARVFFSMAAIGWTARAAP